VDGIQQIREPVHTRTLRWISSRYTVCLHPGNLPWQGRGKNPRNNTGGETMIRIKSIYDSASDEDAFRVFVEPVWPRGVGREKTDLNVWLRDLAPSLGLVDQYSRGILEWEDFVSCYHGELERNIVFFADLRNHGRIGGLTLIHGSRDNERNTAVALKMRLERDDPAAYGKDER
jgi:uncharacterized protein YeaO (DUF488 family)